MMSFLDGCDGRDGCRGRYGRHGLYGRHDRHGRYCRHGCHGNELSFSLSLSKSSPLFANL